MKHTYKSIPRSRHLTIKIRILNSPSRVPFHVINPFCSSLISCSIDGLFMLVIILIKTFGTWLVRLIARCCEYLVAFCFLGIFNNDESFHWSGMCSISYIKLLTS